MTSVKDQPGKMNDSMIKGQKSEARWLLFPVSESASKNSVSLEHIFKASRLMMDVSDFFTGYFKHTCMLEG